MLRLYWKFFSVLSVVIKIIPHSGTTEYTVKPNGTTWDIGKISLRLCVKNTKVIIIETFEKIH